VLNVRSRFFPLFISALCSLLILLAACARTYVKEYVLPNLNPAVTIAEGCDIETVFRAMKIKDTKGVNDFRIYLIATFQRELEGVDELDALPEIAIDSLCLLIPGRDTSVCPPLYSVDRMIPGTGLPDDDGHYRVVFRYDLVYLTDDIEELDLSYVYRLYDRASGEIIIKKTVVQFLVRNHRDQVYTY
jgi:hypothetical protein